MKPIYIFDLDGTLALIDHRRHFITAPPCIRCDGSGSLGYGIEENLCYRCHGSKKDPDFKPDWDAYNNACIRDLPNKNVIRLFNSLHLLGVELKIFSGRDNRIDGVREQTLQWLTDNTLLSRTYADEILTMRAKGDYTEDAILKMRWLGLMDVDDRKRIVCIFDDRDSVVKMWRENGYTCLQVAPGDF